jgi:protein-tyrosine phosphatase/membrane-associated phospholipid phosphatase
MAALAPPAPLPGRVFRRAAIWLLVLAPTFYLTYGFANWLASQSSDVGSIVFDWEYRIPFVAWSIVPYWSINLFYALSLFVNDSPQDVDRLAGRYLTAQAVAVACFIAFPLVATFERPPTQGLPGFMFDVLGGFDKPFNQAPSLHIALLVIIWDHLRRRIARPWRVLWHGWCVFIGLSVLTTWQHHFIDIPTGALLGLFALWLFPRQGDLPLGDLRALRMPRRRRLAALYGAGAVLLVGLAAAGTLRHSPVWLGALWPALSLAIVCWAYLAAGPVVFQKSPEGRVPLASRLLLAPYRIGARINQWIWTRRLPEAAEVYDGVFLGRLPNSDHAADYVHIVDTAAELVRPRGVAVGWTSVPMLDLVPPPAEEVERAAMAVEAARREGRVLICCALGFQRSATVAACWLVATGRARDFMAARHRLDGIGRPVHLPQETGTG